MSAETRILPQWVPVGALLEVQSNGEGGFRFILNGLETLSVLNAREAADLGAWLTHAAGVEGDRVTLLEARLDVVTRQRDQLAGAIKQAWRSYRDAMPDYWPEFIEEFEKLYDQIGAGEGWGPIRG